VRGGLVGGGDVELFELDALRAMLDYDVLRGSDGGSNVA